MPEELISILSKNSDEKDILKHDFETSNYKISVFNNIEVTTKNITENNPILIMVDYSAIVVADRSKVIDLFKAIKSTRSIVYNVPEDTDRRLAFYELGATRVFDKSYALENISHSVRWLANVLSNDDDGKRLYSKGQLEDISLTTLINTLGMENRSGILKIVTANNSGKVYFNEGDIVNAEVGFHKGEKAIIHMLFWEEGDFSFSSSQNEVPERTIYTSNPGIQIAAQMYRNKFKINLEKLGKTIATLRVQNTGDLLADFEDINPKFIEYISRPKTLEETLENPYYTSFETMELLVRLKNEKYLILTSRTKSPLDDGGIEDVVKKAGSKEHTNPLLEPKDAAIIRENLRLKENQSFNILVFSTKYITTGELINDLGSSIIQINKDKKYANIEVSLSGEQVMQIFALQVDNRLIDTLKLLKQKVAGQIFVIEVDEQLDFEYLNYLVRQICGINDVPTVLALSNLKSAEDLTSLKPKIKIPENVEIITFDPKEGPKNIHKALLSLKPFKIKSTPENKRQ